MNTRCMLLLFGIILLASEATPAYAQDECFTEQSGSWSEGGESILIGDVLWGGDCSEDLLSIYYSSAPPDENTFATISEGHTITVDDQGAVAATLVIESGGTLVIDEGQLDLATVSSAGQNILDVTGEITFSGEGDIVHIHNGTQHEDNLVVYLAPGSLNMPAGALVLGHGGETEGSFRVQADDASFHEVEIDAGGRRVDLESGGVVEMGTLTVGTNSELFAAAHLHIEELAPNGGDIIMASTEHELTTGIPTTEEPNRSHTLHGDAGWRILSAPAKGMTVGDLADQALVQGVDGSHPSADINLYTGYDGSSWEAASSTTDELKAGRGLLWYFFGETVDETLAAEEATPEPSDPQVVLNDAEQFTLIGNPYGHPIRVRDLVGHAAPVPRAVQVWRDDAGVPEPGTGGGETGSFIILSDDELVRVWDGMVIDNPEAADAVTVPNAARSDGQPAGESTAAGMSVTHANSTFSTSSEPRVLQLSLAAYNDDGEVIARDEAAKVYFTESATHEWDLWDVRKLAPLSQRLATLAFVGERDGERVLKAQDSRPLDPTAPFDIPVELTTQNVSGSFTIEWPHMDNIPETGWHIELHDRETGQVVDLQHETSYSFTVAAESSSDSAGAEREIVLGESMQASTDEPRFLLSFFGQALPVELRGFTATLDNGRAFLEWMTVSETNNSGFRLMHQSPETDTFSKIGFIDGRGTTSERHEYEFRTGALTPGEHHFRLIQVDHDGTSVETDKVTLLVGIDGRAELFTPVPNPVTHEATISFVTAESIPTTVALYDALGRRLDVLFDETTTAGEHEQVTLSGQDLSSGVYFVRLKGPDVHEVQQVVVVR